MSPYIIRELEYMAEKPEIIDNLKNNLEIRNLQKILGCKSLQKFVNENE